MPNAEEQLSQTIEKAREGGRERASETETKGRERCRERHFPKEVCCYKIRDDLRALNTQRDMLWLVEQRSSSRRRSIKRAAAKRLQGRFVPARALSLSLSLPLLPSLSIFLCLHKLALKPTSTKLESETRPQSKRFSKFQTLKPNLRPKP
jgi:hypothetical protein